MFSTATLLALAALHPAPADSLEFETLHLEVDTSALEDFQGEVADRGHWLGSFRARLGDAALEMEMLVYDRTQFTSLHDPGDVAHVVHYNRLNRARREGGFFDFDASEPVMGDFGELPFGWFAVHERMEGTAVVGHEVYVCGLTDAYGYALQVTTDEPLEESELDALRAWAGEAFSYSGPTLDPNWTDEEATARFRRDAPDEIVADLDKNRKEPLIARTEHYIIFTDIGRGTLKGFSKALEENYDAIQAVYPFVEIEGERLMPVFYFNQRDDYLDWCVKNLGWTRDGASRSGGVATGDVYSTHHQSARAPVHIHEQTHQIFRNRLRLGGGGSWFQEGVAEYMSSNQGDLSVIKRLAGKDEGGLTPLKEFVMVPSLLMSSEKGSRLDGGSNSGVAYKHAAAIVEFVKHSDFGSERFLDWVHAIGQCGRGDLPAIEAATARVLGVDLEAFEERFKAYWDRRGRVRGWHGPSEPRRR